MTAECERAPNMTVDEARKLTRNIQNQLASLWEDVQRAFLDGAWYVLGYSDWDAYVSAEFDFTGMRLPRAQRREAVASLTEAGLSTRQIAAATGASRTTVKKDQKVGQSDPVDDLPEIADDADGRDGDKRDPGEGQALREASRVNLLTDFVNNVFTPDEVANMYPNTKEFFIELLEQALKTLRAFLDAPDDDDDEDPDSFAATMKRLRQEGELLLNERQIYEDKAKYDEAMSYINYMHKKLAKIGRDCHGKHT